MILDTIARRSAYAEMGRLSLLLEYLAAVTPERFPADTVELMGRQVFANPVTLTTKPEDACVFEAHRRYADVHYIIEGCEKIVVADVAGATLRGTFDTVSDFGLFDCRGGTACILHPGDFLVCFPHDAHRVAIAPGEPAAVRKLVGKFLIT